MWHHHTLYLNVTSNQRPLSLWWNYFSFHFSYFLWSFAWRPNVNQRLLPFVCYALGLSSFLSMNSECLTKARQSLVLGRASKRNVWYLYHIQAGKHTSSSELKKNKTETQSTDQQTTELTSWNHGVLCLSRISMFTLKRYKRVRETFAAFKSACSRVSL